MDALYICAAVPSIISIIAVLVCFWFYWMNYFQYIDSGFQLLASQWLDFGLCFFTVFDVRDKPELCKAQGYLLNVFYSASVLWSSFIIFQVYYEYRSINPRGFKLRRALIFTILSSICLAFIPFTSGSYGKNLGFCYMKTNGDLKEMVIIYFHLPFWIFSIFTIVLLRKIEFIVKNRLNDLETQMYFINVLRYFPISLIIAFIPLSIVRLIEIYDNTGINNVDWFIGLSFAISRLHALSTTFFLAYSYYKEQEYQRDRPSRNSDLSDICRSILKVKSSSVINPE